MAIIKKVLYSKKYPLKYKRFQSIYAIEKNASLFQLMLIWGRVLRKGKRECQ
jgi:hypothetical protein